VSFFGFVTNIETFRALLVMTITGAVITAVLFAIRPLMRKRLPKAAQYCLWLVALAAFLAPMSALIAIPAVGQMPSISSAVDRYVVTAADIGERIKPYERTDSTGYVGIPEEYQATVDELVPEPWVTEAVDWAKFLWYIGALISLSVFAFSYYSYTEYVVKKHNIAALPEQIGALAELTGKPPRLFRSAKAATPMLIGLFRPAIILPDREYTAEQLRSVLMHELTHLRRKDILIKWLSVLACSLHWFNPLAWLMRREIDRACEFACDEVVIRKLDADGRQNYGDTLIAVATDSKMPRTVLSTTMCERKKSLKERLGAIMAHKKSTRTAIIVSVVLVLLLAGCAAILGAGSGVRIELAETPAPPYDPNFVFQTKLSIKTQPYVYMLTMSSYPGIHLGIVGQTEGETTIRYEATAGTFNLWEGSQVTSLGNPINRSFTESRAVYWTPDSATKNGDTVSVSFVNGAADVLAQVTMAVSVQDSKYSLIPTSAPPASETPAPTPSPVGEPFDTNIQKQLTRHLETQFTDAYDAYYDGLRYRMSNYAETVEDGKYIATFHWTMYNLGNGLDIESDFGKEQQSNFSFQATADVTENGLLDIPTLVVMSDTAPTGPPVYDTAVEAYFPDPNGGAVKLTDGEVYKSALSTAIEYYNSNSTFEGKVANLTLIEVNSDYISTDKVKGAVAAFNVEFEDDPKSHPARSIILTRETGGEWEVINEGY
jgi:beta-lactamase regulating signal transducer with metallopeptidase domain